MQSNLAHIFEAGTIANWWLIAGVAVFVGLVIEHHLVAGFPRAQLARRARLALAVLVVTALSAMVAPASAAQPAGALLPDLISDPPRPSFFNELNTQAGETRLVITFDGYVHNIGEGALDVIGNPQQPGGMRQRVQVADTWEEVGSPTVRYETDDGHNHFHLIEAIEYVLWNELQGAQTAIGSKIGFCLVDSEQMEPGFDESYSEEGDNFCEENNPGATALRMGISPGWRDIYDATTTLQWVDVSDVSPGRYWLGAITDPNDEIVESNEDNNALIFSQRTITIPGFMPRRGPAVVVDEPTTEFKLASTAHGNVTAPVYTIVKGPAWGTLDVPVGAALGSPVVRYFADPGFVGQDQIVFSVHDAASLYPFTRPTLSVDFEVVAGAGEQDVAAAGDSSQSLAPVLQASSTFFESELGEAFSADFEVTDSIGGPARFFAKGLPAGLVADADTGVISGVAGEEGIFSVELVAVGATPAELTTLDVSWIVNPAVTTGGLAAVLDQSSPRRELTRLRVGQNALGQTFEAEGLPDGLRLEDNAPVIVGSPSTVGTYPVVIRQLDGDDIVDQTSFTWTVRPTTDIDFAL